MSELVKIERRGAILLVGVNRPDKRNAWNTEVIQSVARAYTDLGNDSDLRVGVLYGEGPHFTAGLDLPDVAPRLAGGDPTDVLPADLCDPWDFANEPCPKPIVVAVQGRCLALGMELILASQVTVAADDTEFGQLEVTRGIPPLGGATFRLAERLGARGTRWLLTGERFDAAAALAAGLVSEVVPTGTQLDRALEIAEQIAANAPLAVQAALESQRAAERAARDAAVAVIRAKGPGLLQSADAAEGVASLLERRPPQFQGR